MNRRETTPFNFSIWEFSEQKALNDEKIAIIHGRNDFDITFCLQSPSNSLRLDVH